MSFTTINHYEDLPNVLNHFWPSLSILCCTSPHIQPHAPCHCAGCDLANPEPSCFNPRINNSDAQKFIDFRFYPWIFLVVHGREPPPAPPATVAEPVTQAARIAVLHHWPQLTMIAHQDLIGTRTWCYWALLASLLVIWLQFINSWLFILYDYSTYMVPGWSSDLGS